MCKLQIKMGTLGDIYGVRYSIVVAHPRVPAQLDVSVRQQVLYCFNTLREQQLG